MEKLIKLSYINDLERKLNAENDFIQVLIGPRQVSKTNSILDLMDKKYGSKFLYFSADRVFSTSLEWLREVWTHIEF